MTDTKFIFAYDPAILNKYKAFKSAIVDGYPWVNGYPPQFFKDILVTPLVYEKNMNDIFDQMAYFRSNGDHNFLMFDSGGFQVNSPTNDITPANLVERNLYLYNTYDKADAYVLPDVAINKNQSDEKQTENVKETIKLSRELYNRLPERIQVKSVPVYQVNKKEHIDMQFESHSKISELSGMLCYSIPAPWKKLNFEHMKWILYLKSLQPQTKIHLLGCTSQPAFYCMQQLDVYSCDSISPISIAVNGEIATYTGRITMSNRSQHRLGDNEPTIDEFREATGHRCPFCDPENRERLTNNQFWRIMHNIILYSEVGDYYKRFSFDEYKAYSKTTKKWAITLEKALDSSVSIPEVVANGTEGHSPIADDDTPVQMKLF